MYEDRFISLSQCPPVASQRHNLYPARLTNKSLRRVLHTPATLQRPRHTNKHESRHDSLPQRALRSIAWQPGQCKVQRPFTRRAGKPGFFAQTAHSLCALAPTSISQSNLTALPVARSCSGRQSANTVREVRCDAKGRPAAVAAPSPSKGVAREP
jgi:hypothetical protein